MSPNGGSYVRNAKRPNLFFTEIQAFFAFVKRLAEMEGFEPSRGLTLNPLSRRAH